MANGKSIVDYQRGKNHVSNAIMEVRGSAERLEKLDASEFGAAFYDLLESICYLEELFEGFAEENIPE